MCRDGGLCVSRLNHRAGLERLEPNEDVVVLLLLLPPDVSLRYMCRKRLKASGVSIFLIS